MAEVEAKSVEEAVEEKPEDGSSEASNEASAEKKEEDADKSEKNGDATNPTKKQKEIIRQVEYYFGDANLNRDKFLTEQIHKDTDGWVPFDVILTFKRLAALAESAEIVADAIALSDEGLLEISADRTKIRRHPERPIPEHNDERRKEITSRTAYVKGFPLETDMATLIDFFAPFEKVLNINMRKYHDKPSKSYKFKGSVFVTFEKKSQTQDFIDKEKVIYQDRELLRKWQEKYIAEKHEEQGRNKDKRSKGKVADIDEIELPKGTVVFFEGANGDVTREMLREAVANVKSDAYEIAYVEYSKGEENGHLRFQEENIAAKFLEELTDKKLKLSDEIEVTCRLLDADEEKEFLKKVVEHMKNRRNNQQKNRNTNNRKGGFKRKGGHNNRNDEKKKKLQAAD